MKDKVQPEDVHKFIADTFKKAMEGSGMIVEDPIEKSERFERAMIEYASTYVHLLTDYGKLAVSIPERKIWMQAEDIGYSVLAAIPYTVDGMQHKEFDLFIGENHVGIVKYGGPKPIEASDRGVCLGYETSIVLDTPIKSFTMTVEVKDGE